jgi:hypothetical protein
MTQAHAHTATLHYLSTSSANPPHLPALALALKHFCRAVELNDAYLRGYYGLKLVSSKLLTVLNDSTATTTVKRGNAQDDDEIPIPKIASVKKLEEIATKKLGEIVRNAKAGKTGYDEAEVIAARELLDRDGKIER